jgi:opacity protein-like surface antigen
MFKKTALMLIAIVVVVVPSASAQGWYLGALASYTSLDDIDFGTALGTVTTTFDESQSVGLVLGYDTSMLRIEGEIIMREFNVQDHILAGGALPGPTGEAETLTLMANAIYDFNREGTVQPYIGLGLGWADVELDDFGVEPIPDVLNDSDSGFAYQVFAGLGFELSDNWNLFVDYRWFVASDLSLTASADAGAVSTDVDLEAQDIVVGIRYSF